MKIWTLSLLILAFIFNCSSKPSLTVTGSVTLENSADLTFAQISVQKGGEKVVDLKLISPDFKLQLEPNTIYSITLSAPEHEAFETLLWTKEEPIDIHLYLALERHQISFDPYIIGSFNGFNPQQAVQMEQVTESTWSTTLPTSKGELRYQIMGITPDQRPVTGTQQDTFDYFSESLYTSVIYSNEESVVVTFTPFNTKSDFVSRLESSILSVQNEAIAYTYLANNRKAITAAYIKQYMTGTQGLVINWDSLAMPLEATILTTTDKTEKSILLSAYFDLLLSGFSPQINEMMEQAIYDLGSTNPIWSLNQFAIYAALDKVSNTDQKKNFIKEVTQNHPDSSIVETAIYYGFVHADEVVDTTSRRYYFNKLQSDFPNSQFMEYAKYQFDPTSKVVSGAQVPDFSIASFDGKVNYSNASLKGNYVLLDFWATWCGPCIDEMATLHDTYEEVKSSNFVLLSLSFDNKKDDVSKFRKDRFPMPWNHAFIDGAFDSDIARDFEVSGIPKPILLDPNGRILATGMLLRGRNLKKTLLKYLKS